MATTPFTDVKDVRYCDVMEANSTVLCINSVLKAVERPSLLFGSIEIIMVG